MANPNIPIDRRTNRVELIGLVLGVLLAIWVYKIFPANAGDIALAAAKGKKLHVGGIPVVAAVAALMAAWWMTEANRPARNRPGADGCLPGAWRRCV